MIGTDGIRASTHDHETEELDITDEMIRRLHEKARFNWLNNIPAVSDPNCSVLVPSSSEETPHPSTVAEIKVDTTAEAASDDADAPFIAPSLPPRIQSLIPTGRALNMNLDSFFGSKHDTCRYLIDTGTEHFFCTDIVQENSSYCPDHHALCMVKPKKGNEMRLAPAVVDQGYAFLKHPTASEPAELAL
ncbi:MAG: hypothetical protein H6872_05875 [Methylobacteriaceae bacterium]|nr:hypothetical protein [Methylobacteriaceae bacterium]